MRLKSGVGWEAVASKPPIADRSILSSRECRAAGSSAGCSLPAQWSLWASPTLFAAKGEKRLSSPADGSRWPPPVDVEGLLGGEVHCLKAVDSRSEVVSSPLATRDAWLKPHDVPNHNSQPLRAQTWAPLGPLRVRPGAAACGTPVRSGSPFPSPPFSAKLRVRGTGGGTVPRGLGRAWWPPRPSRVGRTPSRHRPPRAANGGGGAALGLEPARDWPARGPGRGAGEASAVSAVIREGKVPCAESRAGARSYGGRSGRAGPAGRAVAEEDPRSRPRLPRCLSQTSVTFRGPEDLCTAAMGGVGEPGGGPGPREGPAPLGAPLPIFRWEQIRQHDLPGDKWLVIERRVYDISRWAQRHPGGSRLIGHHGAEDATVS